MNMTETHIPMQSMISQGSIYLIVRDKEKRTRNMMIVLALPKCKIQVRLLLTFLQMT